ncbi:MAG: hypothetical protein H6719_37245 [Sandaracinaceae bacterium]|nr:hypothetical protein [Sandaracinaceae bacterium]
MAVRITALECPHCTAPLLPEGGRSTVCAYCGRVLVDLPPTWWARPVVVPPWEGRPEDRGKPRVGLGKHRYVLDRQIATGTSSDVWRAHRDARLTEHVVLKIAHDDGDAAAALRAEHRAIERLRGSGAAGASHFEPLLPQPVALGKLRGDGPAHLAVAYRHKPGFVHPLTKVRARYPSGVDPRVAVWMWKRVLEMLAWVHGSGFVHGDVAPDHCVVHPLAHGVALVGWSKAAWRFGREAVGAPSEDVAASARVFTYVLGGDGGRLPRGVPAPLARIAAESVASPRDDAWAVHAELERMACDLFGPPRHTPLSLDDEG